MQKIKFTTTIDNELLKQIKIIAVNESRSVADILEELIIQYIEQKSK